jgi:hypothetical protein
VNPQTKPESAVSAGFTPLKTCRIFKNPYLL